MKQTVIILSGSDNSNSVYKGRMRELQNMTLKELATEFFPTDTFDVVIFDGLNYDDNIELKKLLKSDDKPILIGYKEGANFIEPIKNYKRKYIVCPYIYSDGSNVPNETTEYDIENTWYMYTNGKDNKKMMLRYIDFYKYIMQIPNLDCEGLCSAMFSIGMCDMYSRKKEN